jgi:dsRNA-specific ribonuclease
VIVTVVVVLAFRDIQSPAVFIGSNAKGSFIRQGPLLAPRREKILLTALQDSLKTTMSTEAAGTPTREGTPTHSLNLALSKTLHRDLRKGDIVFSVQDHEDKYATSPKFRAQVELGCFPKRLIALGKPCQSEKEAKHSAANKMLSDPFFQALSSPAPSQELRNLVNRRLHRPPSKDDLVYFTTEDAGSFVTRVDLTCFGKNVSVIGEPSPTEKEAKRSAVTAVLLNSQVQKLLREQVITPPTAVLQTLLAKKLRTSSALDIAYSFSKNASAPNEFRIISSVELRCLEAGLVYTGCAPTKNEARQAAASAALSDNFLQARLLHNSIDALQNLVNQKFRQSVDEEDKEDKDDILYTVAEHKNASNARVYVATVQLNCLEGHPAREGLSQPSKQAAKHSAADALLSDPQVQLMLRS